MSQSSQDSYAERVLRVQTFIQEHLDEAISVGRLAEIAHFSPYHFHRIFRGMTGEAVMQYVRRLRLERAARELRATDRAVTRIAFDAGFEAHEAFTRAFRAHFGVAPSGYREEHGAGSPSIAPGRAAPAEVRVVEREPLTVVFVRHVGPYRDVGVAWTRLLAAARGLGASPWPCIGLVHDDPEVTPGDKIRYDACVPAPAGFEPRGEFGVQEIRGGPYVVTVHRGPYDALGFGYLSLCGGWLPGSGREAASAPPFEIYLNSPMDTAPEELLTEIWLPLRRTV